MTVLRKDVISYANSRMVPAERRYHDTHVFVNLLAFYPSTHTGVYAAGAEPV